MNSATGADFGNRDLESLLSSGPSSPCPSADACTCIDGSGTIS